MRTAKRKGKMGGFSLHDSAQQLKTVKGKGKRDQTCRPHLGIDWLEQVSRHHQQVYSAATTNFRPSIHQTATSEPSGSSSMAI